MQGAMMIWEYETVRESVNLIPEDDLIHDAQNGNVEAFNQLVLSYQDRVFSIALRILGDGDLAEDITQDTFLAAYRSLSRFRGGSFRAWLYRIATNACYDEVRKHKRHPMLSLEEKEDEYDMPLIQDASQISGILPEHEYEQLELERVIQQAIHHLDVDQRAVVVLVDLQDMDYQEVAQILGVPLGTVKSRLSRARVQLRNLLSAWMQAKDIP
jgi:RNA polymerase sigma factor (sigma-70 family)